MDKITIIAALLDDGKEINLGAYTDMELKDKALKSIWENIQESKNQKLWVNENEDFDEVYEEYLFDRATAESVVMLVERSLPLNFESWK